LKGDNTVEQNKFKLVSDYKPTGDQPQAIETLTNAIKNGNKMQITAEGSPNREPFVCV
jgi:excinuclease UvrABC helicase subunit UvrB